MKHPFFLLITFAVCFFINGSLFAQDIGNKESAETYFKNPFHDIGKNTAESFSGTNILFHAAGIASTYLLIQADIDYKVHDYFWKNRSQGRYIDPALWVGYFLPIVVGGGLYSYGMISDQPKELAVGCAVLQASLISVTYTSLLKAITGRPNPNPNEYSDMKDASRKFRFGFLRGGLHYGWPSGHLAINTAVITSLAYFYPESLGLKIVGGLYLGYLFYGVIGHENATMHWFSDAICGTLMGYAIGSTVGRNFREAWNARQTNSSRTGWHISPVLSSNYQGISISISF